MKKIYIRNLFILLVLSLLLTGCAKNYSGELNYTAPAKDELLGVEVDAPILIRNVEMVQYQKGEDGKIELVFSNKPIVLEPTDSFFNPPFPEDITSEIFYSNVLLDGNLLSDDSIKELAYGDLLKKKELNLSQNDKLKEHNLLLVDNAYISKSDNWKVGEIRITYLYVELQNVSFKGKNVDGKLIIG